VRKSVDLAADQSVTAIRANDDRTAVIHDTLLLFGAALEELQTLWMAEIRPQLTKKAVAQVLGASQRFFGDITDLSREAANVARGAGRSISAGELAAACRLGLSEIFGA
jgi:hypothetical protein